METINQILGTKKINVTIPMTPKDLQDFASEVAKSVLENLKVKKGQDQFLTVNETMEMLKISRTALWRWERKGILKPVKFGRQVRYKLSDIEKIGKTEKEEAEK